MTELLQPCSICKKNVAITACKICGLLVCNEHTKAGYCFACAAEKKRESWRQ